MNEPKTIYTLNNECIVDSLTADIGDKQHLAVPHLSVLKKAHDDLSATISSVSSYLSGIIGGTDCSFNIEVGSRISSIAQTGGMISVGTKPFEVADISAVALIENDFLRTFVGRRIDFSYDSSSRAIYLGLKEHRDSDPSKMLSIDCNEFIKDGMLSSVNKGTDSMGPYIEFIWNAESGKEKTRLYVRDILGEIYKGIDPIVVDQNSLSISLNIASLKNSLGYDKLYSYYQFLAGLEEQGDKGAIKTLSDDVSSISELGIKSLKYLGHIDDPEKLSTHTLVEYFNIGATDLASVYNGAFLPVAFNDAGLKVSTTDVDHPLVVGNGDVVIIHDHSNRLIIDVDDLEVGKNVYVLKAGVSRYEFEELRPGLTTEYIPLSVEGQDAVSVITGVKETDGILHISASVLTPTMISGFREELDKLSCTVTICSALSDFDALTGVNAGDIAVVSVANGVNPLSSGYSVTGYVWRNDISNWVAMNGNYNAKNIYFDYDIVEAGAWEKLGNISHTKNKVEYMESTDKSLAEIMDMIFKGEELFPSVPSPTCNITLTSYSYEIGTNATPKFTLNFDPLKYEYGTNTNTNLNSTTGVSAINYKLTYQIKGRSLSTKTGDWTTTVTDAAFQVSAGTNCSGGNLSVWYGAAGDGLYIPRTNLERVLSSPSELEAYKVKGGCATKTSTANSIVGYYPNFYGFKGGTTGNPTLPQTGDRKIEESNIDSSVIRNLGTTESSGPDSSTGYIEPVSTIAATQSWKQFLYAIPHGLKTSLGVVNGSLPLTINRIQNVEVTHQNGVTSYYDVFYSALDDNASPDNLKLTWS